MSLPKMKSNEQPLPTRLGETLAWKGPVARELFMFQDRAGSTATDERFAELHERFHKAVHGIIFAKLATLSVSDVDDLCQEVFLKVYEGLGSLRDGSALPAWICAIARNVAIDHLRKFARSPKPVPLEEATRARESGDDSELRRQVLAKIATLPQAYHETLVLRLVEGMSGPQIAARTGLTEKSVRVNLCRGMARLRSLLAKDGWS